MILALMILCACGNASNKRPNIVLIMFDDLSTKFGVYKDKIALTPSIDALAASGITFTRAYATSPVCSASRSAIITGVYQNILGTQHHRTKSIDGSSGGGPIPYEAVPPGYIKAFPELLRRIGYQTVVVGKRDYNFGEPFTVWDRIATEDDWISEKTNRPFFAYINLSYTHEGYLWPKSYDESSIIGGVNRYRKTILRNREVFKNRADVTNPGDLTLPPYYPDNTIIRKDIARLYNNIHFLDGKVNKTIKKLKKYNKYDDTVIIITSDQGDPLPRSKRSLYPSGLQVPLIIKLPKGKKRVAILDGIVSLIDIAPTVLNLAGANVPDYLDGLNLLDIDDLKSRKFVFASSDRMDSIVDRRRTIIGKSYQLIRNFNSNVSLYERRAYQDVLPSMKFLWREFENSRLNELQSRYFSPSPDVELYDLSADKFSINDLSENKKYRKIERKLSHELDEWLSVNDKYGEAHESDMINIMWPNMRQPKTYSPNLKIRENDNYFIVELQPRTQGASIGYSISPCDDNTPEWKLYIDELKLPLDFEGTLRSKSIRYGYSESEETILSRCDTPDI